MIERDTVVLADVIVGRGGSRVKVSKQYCVIEIHDKYYNNWFMTNVPQKIFVFGKDYVTPNTNSRFARRK